MSAISDLTSYFKSQVGYLEKKSNNQLEDFTANAGYNNYTKYGAYFGHNGPDAYWCDYFVDYCFCQVFGRDMAGKLLGGFSGYTPTSAQYFKKMGRWHTDKPQEGDIVFFENSVRINHTGYVYKVNGSIVYTIEGNTSTAAGVIRNGGGVAAKEYPSNSVRIAGYGRPDYSLVEITPEYVEGWQRAADGVRWWYQYSDGSYAKSGWKWLTEATGGTSGWYLFDDDGYMLTGYQKDPAGEYFFLCPDKGIHEGQCMVTDDRGKLYISGKYDFENHKYL